MTFFPPEESLDQSYLRLRYCTCSPSSLHNRRLAPFPIFGWGLGTRLAQSIMAVSSRVIVYGGKGALGSVIVNYFKAKNWVS